VLGRRVRWWGWVGLVGVGLAVWFLWRFEPAGQVFYPRCWSYQVWGVKCAGCGVLRATHALLRGEWALAWSLNPLWVCYLPVMGWAMTAWLANGFGIRIGHPFNRPWVYGGLIGLAFAYGIARNLPGWEWLG
jgi:hypothetical protein